MKKLLPEVCTIQYGFPFDSAKFSDSNGMPLIRIRDVVRGYSETYTTEEYKSEYIVHENDLLIGMDGEFNIAKWGKTPALLNQRVCRLAPKDSIDKDYLFYFMPIALKRIEEKTPFVTVKHLSAKELNKIEIPVLSLEEQRKIAETLSKVDKLIAFREQQLAKLDELVKARFVEMFGDPVSNPKHWKTAFLLDIGYCKNGMNFHKGDSGVDIHCLGVGDFKNRTMIQNVEDLPFVSLNELPDPEYLLRDNDIIFVRSNGNKELVGRCLAIYPGSIPVTYSGFCIRYRLTSTNIDTPYLLQVLKTDSIRKKMTGRGANIQNLNQQTLSQLLVPIPPLSLQNEFAAFVERVDQQKQTIQQSLEKLELMKKVLMQEYFG